MNQMIKWLSGGDLRSDGMANEVVTIVLENPLLFADLLACLKQSEDVVRARSTDALEKIARTAPELFTEHIPQLLRVSKTDSVALVRMHLAMLFGHLAPLNIKITDLLETLLYLLNDDSVFTKSWAIVSLCIIARLYPNHKNVVIDHISRLQSSQSVAIRSKVKQANIVLLNEDASFPKGWIKSNHLPNIE